MKKPLKVLSTTGLAAVFAASAIVPVAAAETPVEEVSFEKVVLEHEGKPFEMDVRTYLDEVAMGTEFATLKYVKSSEGKYYHLRDYLDILSMTDEKTVFEELDSEDLEIKLDKTGTVEVNKDGKVQYNWDDQPEDRLNETFFYNAA